MKLKLDFNFEANPAQINTQSQLVFTGSCFANHIHLKLAQLKFNSHFLGNGIVFHPNIIAAYLVLCNTVNKFPEKYLFEHKGIWHSWLHHGAVWANSKQDLLNNINFAFIKDQEQLRSCTHLIITFGSSYVYTHNQSGIEVANCHKVPAIQFTKTLSLLSSLNQTWDNCMLQLKQLNPNVSFIFSVSPVKYIKDGIHQNNLSKANLLLLTEQICTQYHTYYFPAFEILQDELRDYRFYDVDFAHPNQQAIDYIFDLFLKKCFDMPSQEILSEITNYNKLLAHRILHENSSEHLQLEEKKRNILVELKLRYPFLNW